MSGNKTKAKILENPKEVRKIDYATMHCDNCGNFAPLQCKGYPDDPNKTGIPCDLWVTTDYFDYTNAYPLFEVVNIPDIECTYCDENGEIIVKHCDNPNYENPAFRGLPEGMKIKCTDCNGTKTVKPW